MLKTAFLAVALVSLASCGGDSSSDDYQQALAQANAAQAAAASDNSALLDGASAAAASASEAPAASAPEPPPTLHTDRGPPPDVPPIVRDGVRYAQGDAERDQGLAQASGMLVVSDDFSGKRLWTLAVYNAGVDAKRDASSRSIFFKTMAFDPDGRLRVVNEDDQAFLVDVRRHVATPAPARPDADTGTAIVR